MSIWTRVHAQDTDHASRALARRARMLSDEDRKERRFLTMKGGEDSDSLHKPGINYAHL